MKRHLVQFGFAFGVLAALTAAALFVRGFWRTDEIRVRWTRENDPHYLFVEENFYLRASCRHVALVELRYRVAADDGLPFARQPFEVRHFTSDAPAFRMLADNPWDGLMGRLGFAYREHLRVDTARPGQENRRTAVPTWVAVLTCAAPTALPGWRRWRRRHRARLARGLCVTCGYDLRGAAHERCPECGGTVAAQAI